MEGLITLFVFLLVMVVFASLAREYRRVSTFSSARQQAVLAASVGLEGAAAELRGAVRLLQPGSVGATSSNLVFQIVNPNQRFRLNPAVNPPRIPVLNLNANANLLTLEYASTGQTLQRRVTEPGPGLVSTQAVAQGVVGFSARWNPDQTATLEVTVREVHRLRSLTQVVLLLEGI